MDSHFHLLLRVPHRPEGLDVPLKIILARMERAVGEEALKLVRRDLRFWETTGNVEAIEEWRQRQMKRMYSMPEFMGGMPEFMGGVKQRFTRWHNAKSGRRGTIWEERYGSVVVEEEERALRTMAAYLDLNPVRAGMAATGLRPHAPPAAPSNRQLPGMDAGHPVRPLRPPAGFHRPGM